MQKQEKQDTKKRTLCQCLVAQIRPLPALGRHMPHQAPVYRWPVAGCYSSLAVAALFNKQYNTAWS